LPSPIHELLGTKNISFSLRFFERGLKTQSLSGVVSEIFTNLIPLEQTRLQSLTLDDDLAPIIGTYHPNKTGILHMLATHIAMAAVGIHPHGTNKVISWLQIPAAP